ncbi:cytochrome c1 heme lyase-like protein [Nadsonia fulvescens var. elongata DSM 6958]|uniref:Holocytochrome c-type synthase n=1 Tax=Nadsonia fulvescens var. elongata DSM 6958 TaxID=857566 RepID=A0A1E3PF49_9ASCO|nr:cytochrome c1 heme lyase-like protein [Nadsonia fulvescens var. elongata DSM 6958]
MSSPISSSTSQAPEGVCPVDHATRDAWVKNSQKSAVEEQPVAVTAPAANASIPLAEGAEQPKCPVDHETRDVWLKSKTPGTVVTGASPGQVIQTSSVDIEECSSDKLDQNVIVAHGENLTGLSRDREISSIPRADGDKNWVYPSQEQFFNAMKRKNWDPNARDMETIVPIHNAVNERAWYEILRWEEGRGGEACGGPTLVSFKGDSKALTPAARWNMLFGAQKPFDRHDWVVNRCGTNVHYVIDFYTGKPNPVIPDMPSFYLDVRPKINTFEGVKMRIGKFLGF